MAPAELRVPEAMIALDLWLPAVQEVAFKNYDEADKSKDLIPPTAFCILE